MHNILVPVDGSIHALKAAHIACDFAQKYEGKVSLLYVVPKEKSAEKLLSLKVASSYGPKLKSLLKAQSKTTQGLASPAAIAAIGELILSQAARKVRHQGVEVSVLPIVHGEIVEQILAHIESIGASVVVLGSRGVSDANESAFGSVSHAVFAQAQCTCLAVK